MAEEQQQSQSTSGTPTQDHPATEQPDEAKAAEAMLANLVSGVGNDLPKAVRLGNMLFDELKRRGIRPLQTSYPKDARKFAKSAGVYPIPNVAVIACSSAWAAIIKEESEKLDNSTETDPRKRLEEVETCRRKGKIAYCESLPKLSSRDEVTDFIACVVHGMALDIIPGPEGTRLLYGAQVALGSLAPRKKYKKQVKSRSQDASA
jgi:hypothetical protein